jgi:hypothetical protein
MVCQPASLFDLLKGRVWEHSRRDTRHREKTVLDEAEILQAICMMESHSACIFHMFSVIYELLRTWDENTRPK